jgi:tetratricopeptide (TPR) repeat protein
MNIGDTLRLAFENHRQGNLKQAELFYKKILKKQPDNPDVLHMLGVLSCQRLNYDSAIKYIEKALRFRSDNPEAHCNLGVALQEKGRLDEAIAHYRRAIELNSSFAKAYCNLGNALHVKGLLDEAVTNYRRAIELNPSFAKAYSNLGNALREEGKVEEAITYCEKAIGIDPSFAEAYCNLGAAFRDKKLLNAAIANYRRAIELNPSFAKAQCNLGNALQEKGLLDEAITHYQMAIELNPSFAKAYSNLGNALREKELFDQAIVQCKKAIELNPSFAEAYCHLGATLQERGDIDQAIVNYEKALAHDPSLVEAYCLVGTAFQDKGNIGEARKYYERAIELNPQSESANFNMSLIVLQSGDFSKGWEQFEWRWKAESFLKRSSSHQPGEFTQPVWDGTSLEGKSILIYSEQGIGDEIMFASCLKEVVDQADKCIVECDRRLMPIFSRSFPGALFIERKKDTDACLSELPQTDVVIAIGSLPGLLRTDFSSFPGKSYLVADPEKVHKWRDRFRELGDGLTVGISWRGGLIERVRRKRSIELGQWAGLFSLPGLKFINLQYGDCRNELKEVREKFGITIHDWEDADPLKDLDNFAAEIAAADLIISIDNSTVHMAGALGRPVWVLLPFMPDWRWMSGREDSPWYQTVRLFRQSSPGDWGPVMERVSGELKVLIEDKKGGN